MSWVPIKKYGEFHDIPRVFAAGHQGALYVFDCPFSEDLDDYPDSFTVYRLSQEDAHQVEAVPWAELIARGTRVGLIQAKDITFDATKRNAIAAHTFDLIS